MTQEDGKKVDKFLESIKKSPLNCRVIKTGDKAYTVLIACADS